MKPTCVLVQTGNIVEDDESLNRKKSRYDDDDGGSGDDDDDDLSLCWLLHVVTEGSEVERIII